MIIYICYVAFGAVSLVTALFAPLSDYQRGIFSGFATGFLVIGLASLIRQYRLTRNPEKAEEWIAMQNEERTAFIAQKARAWTFFIFVLAELSAGIICIFALDDKLLGEVLCYMVAAQGLCYAVLYKILSRKY